MKKIPGRFTLLSIAVMLIVSEASAIGSYVGPLSTIYGNGSCASCHIDPGGGGERNAYGKLFEEQRDHLINPTAALNAIGAPEGQKPVQTAVETPSSTPAPSSTQDLISIDTPSNSDKANMPSYVSDAIERFNHAISILLAWRSIDISDDSIDSDHKSTASKDDNGAIRIDDDHEEYRDAGNSGEYRDDDRQESMHYEERDDSDEDDDS